MNDVLEIVALPALRDNYIWCLHNRSHAAVVDAGAAAPVLGFLARKNLTLCAILSTHHHGDHTGGNAELAARFRAPVYGPRSEAIPALTHGLAGGEQIVLPELPAQFEVLAVPGHTSEHLAYYGANRLFCGDTLFGCGCGRLFEGTARQMAESLTKLAALPDGTEVYCGHEYTLANIRFALAADPENPALRERERNAVALRESGLPTVPSTLALEKATNPFLRCGEPALAASVSRHAGKPLADPVAVFAALREWKDNFSG